ncbi:MAG: diacylglycerol kinase [Sphingomonas bacterium]|uniref:diacylglycerol/lipid kinase family protein n=1 Tax=Sphingomonas bacterium TaxID=1895847 RepID=UPI002615A850|nr:diacylglycerol kinase family protein [Sphingomonas bacterium]MDB5696700.1 diacylglycerol kinase [Sphingomonas bacterium]
MTRPIRSAALIVNARSRSGQAQFAEVCALLDRLPFPVDSHAVEDPKQLTATLDKALAKKPDLVILGGGDGTVSGLVDQLVGANVILGVLPFGTANSFVRSLGIPLDMPGAVDVLATGAPRRIDLGRIDKDYYCNCATLGIAPQIAQSVPHGLKKVAGRLGYLTWAAWEFLRFRPFTLIIGEGATAERLRVVEVRIANGGYHGGTEMVESAEVNSGEIVVQAVVGKVRRRLVKNWVASLLRLPARHEDVREFHGRSIRIATEPRMPISIDGEVLARTPVTAAIAAGVIEVMAPVEAAAA